MKPKKQTLTVNQLGITSSKLVLLHNQELLDDEFIHINQLSFHGGTSYTNVFRKIYRALDQMKIQLQLTHVTDGEVDPGEVNKSIALLKSLSQHNALAYKLILVTANPKSEYVNKLNRDLKNVDIKYLPFGHTNK
ncbi:hypothetical protein [Alkalibacillus aidingensis]|uniref:hypothetical protein n=1 Tax=Alkalibacillus aidingensis TaxID=2747607 RepID=UPI00166103A2|nr:hypothetical protein [Alkalibacillus aidingensis]